MDRLLRVTTSHSDSGSTSLKFPLGAAPRREPCQKQRNCSLFRLVRQLELPKKRSEEDSGPRRWSAAILPVNLEFACDVGPGNFAFFAFPYLSIGHYLGERLTMQMCLLSGTSSGV